MPTTPDQYSDDEPRCTHCRHLLYDTELNRWACRPCEDRSTKQLAELIHLYEELAGALQPGAAPRDDGGKVSISPAAPLPVALTPLDLRSVGGICTKLQAIEDSWRAVLGWSTSPRTDGFRLFASWRANPVRDVPAHAKFLINNLPWACERYEEIAYDLDVISGLYWQAKNTLSGTRPRVIRVQCRALVGDDAECGEQLAVDINRTSALCGACGTRWGREEWVQLYEYMQMRAA